MQSKPEIGILRIFACYLVIISHLVCLVVFNPEYSHWDSANTIYVLRSCCVPLFLVISGILLLNKDIVLKKQLIGSVKFILTYLIAAFLYQLYMSLTNNEFTFELNSIASLFSDALTNPKGHLWYLPMIAQLYIIIPILKWICNNSKILKLFLAIWMFAAILRPVILQGLYLFSDSIPYILYRIVNQTINLFSFAEFYSYAGYMLLGYFLYYEFSPTIKWELLIGGYIFVVIVSAALNKFTFTRTGLFLDCVWNYLAFTACGETICLTLFTKNYLANIHWNIKTRKNIMKISSYTFGVFLIHPLLTEKAFPYFVDSNLYITIPCIALLIMACSTIIVLIEKQIIKLLKFPFQVTQLKKCRNNH